MLMRKCGFRFLFAAYGQKTVIPGLSSTTTKREIAFRTNLLITAQVRLRPKFKKWDIFWDIK